MQVNETHVFYSKTSTGYEVVNEETNTIILPDDSDWPQNYWVSETHEVYYWQQ